MSMKAERLACQPKLLLQRRLVPLAGIEPARCCHHQILSLARLPVPPQGQWRDHRAKTSKCQSLAQARGVDTFAAEGYAKRN
jgi:hypothetical protein